MNINLKLKSKMELDKSDKKGTYITLFMLIMLCILFFTMGYGYAAKKQIISCNDYITEEVMPYCLMLTEPGGIQNEEKKYERFSDFNLTQT